MSVILKNIILSFLLLNGSLVSMAQEDSLAIAYAVKKDILELQEEQKELNFKKFFFDALQHKAIGNFDRAISALENCKNIKENNKAVNFELGKNYFELEKYFEAESYLKKALDNDPENLYILLLLKDVYNKQSNFIDALEVQKKIVVQAPGHQLDLVILYIKNQQIDNARTLLKDLEKKGMLTPNLVPFKESLINGKVLTPVNSIDKKPIAEMTVEELKNKYKSNKSFNILKQLLIKLDDKKQYLELEIESSKALELFPAQPLVYYMNGKAFNQQKQYEKALSVLQNGLDYIVDDAQLEADFYEEISLSFKGLGQNVNASKYLNKAKALREKKS